MCWVGLPLPVTTRFLSYIGYFQHLRNFLGPRDDFCATPSTVSWIFASPFLGHAGISGMATNAGTKGFLDSTWISEHCFNQDGFECSEQFRRRLRCPFSLKISKFFQLALLGSGEVKSDEHVRRACVLLSITCAFDSSCCIICLEGVLTCIKARYLRANRRDSLLLIFTVGCSGQISSSFSAVTKVRHRFYMWAWVKFILLSMASFFLLLWNQQ